MLVLPKLNYRFDVIPIKTLASYFVATERLILYEEKKPQIANLIVEENSKIGGLTDTSQPRDLLQSYSN